MIIIVIIILIIIIIGVYFYSPNKPLKEYNPINNIVILFLFIVQKANSYSNLLDK